MSIATQLVSINDTKQAIKTAIEGKGQVVGSIPFDQYPSKINDITTTGVAPSPVPYTRPSHWRTLPTITASDQRVVGLVEIAGYPGSNNFVNFICNGAYTVDWGDGVTENYAAGTTAQHDYNYATVDAGFITETGRKQCIISITPQSGQNLTVFNIQVRPTTIANSIGTLWVELVMSLPQVTTLTLSGTTVYHTMLQSVTCQQLKDGLNASFNNLFAMEYCSMPDAFINGNTTSGMFRDCKALISAPMFNTVNVTNCSSMFSDSNSLQYVPLYNLAKVTNSSGMFNQCRSLAGVPQFDLALCTDANTMFGTCYSLTYVPAFNTPVLVNAASMFIGCVSLTNAPLFNTANVTNMDRMFNACGTLRTVPLFNTANVTNMDRMFMNCSSLEEVPLFNTSKVTNMTNMFFACYALTTIPEFDFTKVTTIYTPYDGFVRDCLSLERLPESMKDLPVGLTTLGALASGCKSLKYIPQFVNTANWTTIIAAIYNYGMLNDCQSLREIPPMDLSGLTSLASGYVISNPYSLERSQITGLKYTHSYTNSRMSKTALLEVFGNLGIAAAQTLTITNSVGALLNPVISRSSTTTNGSNVVAQANTTGLVVGMLVTGTGIMGSRSGTADVTTDAITATAHGLADGKRLAFTSIGTVTGIAVNTPYYVVNGTTDTYQISLTNGGAPINLTGTGSAVTYQVGSLITAVTTNTNVTLDAPATASGTVTLVYRDLDTSIATLKGWTVTG